MRAQRSLSVLFVLVALVSLVTPANVLLSCDSTFPAVCASYLAGLQAMGHVVTSHPINTPITTSATVGKDLVLDASTISDVSCGGTWAGGTTAATLNAFLNSGRPVFFGMENGGFNPCITTKLAVLNAHTSDSTITAGSTLSSSCSMNTAAALGPDHGCVVTTPNSISGGSVTCLAVNDFSSTITGNSRLVLANGVGVHGIWGGADATGPGAATKRMVAWSDINWAPGTTDLPQFTNIITYLLNGCGPVCDDSNNPPVIAGCQPDQVGVTDPGRCCMSDTFPTPTATDPDTPCTTVGTPFRTDSSITCFPNNYYVRYQVNDGGGNSDSCTWRYTVTDNQAPSPTCPSNFIVNTAPGTCAATITYSLSSTDNCGTSTITTTSGPTSGTSTGPGSYPITATARDPTGNTASCTFRVTVADNQNPTITCPSNINVGVDLNQCGARVTYSIGSGDNCPGVTVSRTAGLASGSLFPVGTTTVTHRATDAAGRVATCSFTVTVVEDQNPAISCPSNIVTNTDVGVCTATETYSVGYSDNCPGGGTSLISGQPSGFAFPLGTTTNNWQARDAAGNTASCSFTVQVSDAEDPTITCPANISSGNDPGVCTAAISYSVSSNDNCPGRTVTLTAGQSSGASFPVGVTTNSYTVRDGTGNVASCSFSVSVTDDENPVITCPASVTQSNDPGMCSANVFYTIGYGDNCAGGGTSPANGFDSGDSYPVGGTSVQHVATDSAGNTAGCTFSVVVNDDENPSISCPANIVVNNDPGVCGAAVSYAIGSADNCPGETVSRTAGLASGSTFPVGSTSVAHRVEDNSGNSESCGFVVTVNDSENVSFTSCPSDFEAASNVPFSYSVSAVDNCGSVSYSVNGPNSGESRPVGVYPVEWTATDNSGNSATCSFTITVVAAVVTSGSVTANLYMYLPMEAELHPLLLASLGSDTDCRMELRAQGSTTLAYTTGYADLATHIEWDGAHNVLPQWVEVWLRTQPSGTTYYVEDLRLCASPFVNDPPGCAVAV